MSVAGAVGASKFGQPLKCPKTVFPTQIRFLGGTAWHRASSGTLEGMAWSTFLKSHWDCIAAADPFTVEVWSRIGLTRSYVLFFIRLSSRHVHIAPRKLD